MIAIVEAALAFLLQDVRGHDAGSFCRGAAFADCPVATIRVTSPDCGESPAALEREYTADGAGRPPMLQWRAPESVAPFVREWLLVFEDPDAPLPTPIPHGVYGGIPRDKTLVVPADFEVEDENEALLAGGFHYGINKRSTVYAPPRPLKNHGVHRYFFQVVALSQPLDKALLASKPSREQVAKAIRGKVIAWGLWVGNCERRLWDEAAAVDVKTGSRTRMRMKRSTGSYY